MAMIEEKNILEKGRKSSLAFYMNMDFDHGDLAYFHWYWINCRTEYPIQNFVGEEEIRTQKAFGTPSFSDSIFCWIRKKCQVLKHRNNLWPSLPFQFDLLCLKRYLHSNLFSCFQPRSSFLSNFMVKCVAW